MFQKSSGGIFYAKSLPPLSPSLDAGLSLYSSLAFSGSSSAQVHAGESVRAIRDALISLAEIGIFPRWSVGPLTKYWFLGEPERIIESLDVSPDKVIVDGAFSPLAEATIEALETLVKTTGKRAIHRSTILSNHMDNFSLCFKTFGMGLKVRPDMF